MNRDRDAERRRVAALRAIPLTTVLTCRGAEQDRSDRAKWHTERGPISVIGEKFFNWTLQRGGGGAIDLVMHLADVNCGPACQWLEQHLEYRGSDFQLANSGVDFQPAEPVRKPSQEETDHRCPRHSSVAANEIGKGSSRRLLLPPRDDRRLPRVREYLERQRGLPSYLLDPLIASGKLYADSRSNAVFLLVSGRAEHPVGAELRGTGPRIWRGLALGTNKDAGYFWTGLRGSRRIILCESAIDALSCVVLFPDRICLSTSGVRSNPAWLRGLIRRGYEIHCGFDADEPGDRMSTELLKRHPQLRRLRPWVHDWNDVLKSTPPQPGITPG